MTPIDRLATWPIPGAEQRVELRDCMLYGLSVGFGSKPTDPGHLRYVSEVATSVVPSMVLTLAAPGFWFKEPRLGLDWARLLNVEQSVRIERLPEPGASLGSRSEIVNIVDKGPTRGALVGWRRDLFDSGSGRAVASVLSTVLLRKDGRAERIVKDGPTPHVTAPPPERAPDLVVDVPTAPNSGLLYRLNGTLNPLHADPVVAAKAGFPRPIMPGTASLGFACAALLEACCAYDPGRLAGFGAKLTAPVYPGDVLRHEFWRGESDVAFRVTVRERDAVVLNHGRAELRADPR